MRNAILFIIMLISVCSIQCCFGDTILDFPCEHYTVATRADMAQLITVPFGSDTKLDSFQFYNMIGAGGVVKFNAIVSEFDPIKLETIGTPLYNSGLQYTTAGSRKTYTFNTKGINLKPGGHYVLDLQQQSYGNSGNLDIGVAEKSYSDGMFVTNWYGHWYSSSLVSTLAFKAVFTPVPEPSTIALLLTASLGGLLWWRRR